MGAATHPHREYNIEGSLSKAIPIMKKGLPIPTALTNKLKRFISDATLLLGAPSKRTEFTKTVNYIL